MAYGNRSDIGVYVLTDGTMMIAQWESQIIMGRWDSTIASGVIRRCPGITFCWFQRHIRSDGALYKIESWNRFFPDPCEATVAPEVLTDEDPYQPCNTET